MLLKEEFILFPKRKGHTTPSRDTGEISGCPKRQKTKARAKSESVSIEAPSEKAKQGN